MSGESEMKTDTGGYVFTQHTGEETDDDKSKSLLGENEDNKSKECENHNACLMSLSHNPTNHEGKMILVKRGVPEGVPVVSSSVTNVTPIQQSRNVTGEVGFDTLSPGQDYTVNFGNSKKDLVLTHPLYKCNEEPPEQFLENETDESSWHYMTCKKAKKNQWEETVIPVAGCYDYYFTSKKYIKHEHKVLMGRIHVWSEQCTELIRKFDGSKQFSTRCFQDQLNFIENKVPKLLEEISEFDHCVISILQRPILYKIFDSCVTVDVVNLLYEVANCKEYHIIARPDLQTRKFEVATSFDCDYHFDYAFGKASRKRVPRTAEERRKEPRKRIRFDH